MFGIGLPEMLLILALALIVVGPDKLPELARSLAKGIMELKKTAEGVKDQLKDEANLLEDVKPDLEDAANTLKSHMLNHPDTGNSSLFGDSADQERTATEEAAAAYKELTESGVNPEETPAQPSTSNDSDGISATPRKRAEARPSDNENMVLPDTPSDDESEKK